MNHAVVKKEKLYSAEEIAKILGVTPAAIRWHARTHHIGTKVSGAWVFRGEDDLALMGDHVRHPKHSA